MSETNSCRSRLARYCKGNGCDLGFGGGKPIVPNAICIDRNSHGVVGDIEPHLIWDVFDPLPFREGVLDFCFSSHVLEDAENTRAVLDDWMSVIKPGGHLVLFLPDQQTYLAHAKKYGYNPNLDHKHGDFSLEFVKEHLFALGIQQSNIVHELFPVPDNAYSFDLVIRV